MRAVVAGALALTLLAGCGGGGDGGDEPAATGPTTSSTVAGCPPLAPPAGSLEPSNASGDFDGDAQPDRLFAHRTSAGGPWRLRLELAAGGGAETELPATAEGVKAVGGRRLDVGSAEAAFAVVDRGPAGPSVGLFVLGGCRLQRVTAGGRPAEFPVGRTSTSRAGLACQVPGLVAYEATTTDGRSYRGTTVGYLLVGTVLDEAHRSTSSLGTDETLLAPYGAFSCGPLAL